MDCARCGASACEAQANDRSKDRSSERANGGAGRFDFQRTVLTPIVGYRLKSSSVTTITARTAHLGSQLLVLRPSPPDSLISSQLSRLHNLCAA
jgi:hypothetical protein